MSYLSQDKTLDAGELDCDGPGGDKRGRKENGLVELTKKFIDLLKEADG